MSSRAGLGGDLFPGRGDGLLREDDALAAALAVVLRDELSVQEHQRGNRIAAVGTLFHTDFPSNKTAGKAAVQGPYSTLLPRLGTRPTSFQSARKGEA